MERLATVIAKSNDRTHSRNPDTSLLMGNPMNFRYFQLCTKILFTLGEILQAIS